MGALPNAAQGAAAAREARGGGEGQVHPTQRRDDRARQLRADRHARPAPLGREAWEPLNGRRSGRLRARQEREERRAQGDGGFGPHGRERHGERPSLDERSAGRRRRRSRGGVGGRRARRGERQRGGAKQPPRELRFVALQEREEEGRVNEPPRELRVREAPRIGIVRQGQAGLSPGVRRTPGLVWLESPGLVGFATKRGAAEPAGHRGEPRVTREPAQQAQRCGRKRLGLGRLGLRAGSERCAEETSDAGARH